VKDITERKQMEEKLRESEKWYRTLIQTSSDIIFVLDEVGTIRYMSPSVERIVGYKPEDMVGKNGFSYYHPEDMIHEDSTRWQRFSEFVIHHINRDSSDDIIENLIKLSRKAHGWAHSNKYWHIMKK